MSSNHSRLSTQDTRLRQGILGIFCAPLLGAFTYAHGYRLPLTCPIRYVTGFPCPTCGMTRSFMAIGQGHWLQATNSHCFGPILFFICAGIVMHITFELVMREKQSTVYSRLLNQKKIQFLGIGIYLGYYFVRLLFIGYPQ